MFYVHSPVRAPARKYNAWLLVSESPEDGSNALLVKVRLYLFFGAYFHMRWQQQQK